MSWLTFLAVALRVTSPDSPSAASNSPSKCFSSVFLLTYDKCTRKQQNREQSSDLSSIFSYPYLWLPIHLLNRSCGDEFVSEFAHLPSSFLWASVIEGLKRENRRGSKLHFVTSELPKKVGHHVSALFKIWWAQEVSISTANTFWIQCLTSVALIENLQRQLIHKGLPVIRIGEIFSIFLFMCLYQPDFKSPLFPQHNLRSHSFCCSSEHVLLVIYWHLLARCSTHFM